ncbi:MAG TPA: hypothetical protein VJ957_09515 [Longimicrobiales bacterium]|nr:hypothetical protein [Longimicrobiales bacterium]
MSPAPLVIGLCGLLGLLAFGAAVWRRKWALWLLGYTLTALAIVAALLRGGS